MRISVVMATYNGGQYIIEQLNSIRKQTRLPDEVIVYDDRSTDSTSQLIEKYIIDNSLNNWKLYINEKNLGYVKNFYQAMDKASGDLIFLCDQDDIWHTNKIEQATECFECNNKIGLLITGYNIFYESGDSNKQVSRLNYFNNRITKMPIDNNWPCIKGIGASFVFRKEILSIVKMIRTDEYIHDVCLWHAGMITDCTYLLPEVMMDYRRHGKNVSGHYKRTTEFRVKSINNQLMMLHQIKQYVSTHITAVTIQDVDKQIAFWTGRKEYLEKIDIFKWIGFIRYLSYFDRKRNWISDLWCMINNLRGER